MQTNATTYIWLGVVEYSGISTTAAFEDATGAAATSSSSSMSAGNVTASGPNNVVVGFFHDKSQKTNMAPGSGYMDIANSGLTTMLEDLYPVGWGTYNPNATYGGGSDA